MTRLSVVVITHNEEQNIRRCLQSVRWADELIVVDSLSTDRTVEIARGLGATVLEHAYDGDIPQRERGFAAATGDWLMYIDADEEVSADLGQEIRSVLAGPPIPPDGYWVLRKSMIFGTWTEHGGWFPDRTFRLFRSGRQIAERAEVHGGFTVRGEQGSLRGLLYHYTYETVEQYLTKMNDYTSLAVSNKLADDPASDAGPVRMILSPLSHFLRKYFSNRGYKDGVHGFILAGLGAVYTLALYAKVWEYRLRQREGKGILPPITNLELQRLKRP